MISIRQYRYLVARGRRARPNTCWVVPTSSLLTVPRHAVADHLVRFNFVVATRMPGQPSRRSEHLIACLLEKFFCFNLISVEKLGSNLVGLGNWCLETGCFPGATRCTGDKGISGPCHRQVWL